MQIPSKMTLTRSAGLDEAVMRALGESAMMENRDPRDHAVTLIREGLEARGFMKSGKRRVVLVLSEERAERVAAALRGTEGNNGSGA